MMTARTDKIMHVLLLIPSLALGGNQIELAGTDWRKSALPAAMPDKTILHLDIDGDGRPDILERWWNGKRVRWLDENRNMSATDSRGDLTGDVLQCDMDGDGFYDGKGDINMKWIDRDGDGVPDMQVFAQNAEQWPPKDQANPRRWGMLMIFINHDNRGTLGWMDWTKWNFNCWGYTGKCNWLPNYHDGDFLKTHCPPVALRDPRFSWENPFSFFDLDGDGLSEMSIRWSATTTHEKDGTVSIRDHFDMAHLCFDLFNNSSQGRETAYSMTLCASGPSTLRYGQWRHPVKELKGDPRFDACFLNNNWRRIDELVYIPREKQYDAFFEYGAKQMWMVFDEDNDNYRWERVEMLYPSNRGKPTDPWLLPEPKQKPGTQSPEPSGASSMVVHRQADSLGDRAEFDLDNSGNGKLYIGRFDRKLHLYGAEWGAWTVDRKGEFNGGVGTPSPTPLATRLGEVVRYTDTDHNGFIDRIEFDYDGDRKIDLTINLLDWRSDNDPHPDVAELLDTQKLGWKGLHERMLALAEQSWQEALTFYRAAWRLDLTDAETDRLAVASSYAERYDHAYWLKETILRRCLGVLAEKGKAQPDDAQKFGTIEKELVKACYLGDWKAASELIMQMPSL